MEENTIPHQEEVTMNKADTLLDYDIEEYGLVSLGSVGCTTLIGACIGCLFGIMIFIKK